jgi:hypothetical protein
MKFIFSFLLGTILSAQTLGQFRIVDFSPRTAATVQSVAGTTLTITPGSFPLHTGDAVYIYPPISWATDASEPNGFANHGNRGRGYFVITATDATHFTLTSEMFTGATTGIGNGVAAGDKIVPLTTYYLRQGPRGWLDGPVSKGAWNSRTTYKPLEMVSAPDGNFYEAIEDNTNRQPPDASCWKQIDPSKAGPGIFTASVRNTSSGGRANVNNFAFTRAQNLFTASWGPGHSYDYSNQILANGTFGTISAWLWLGTDNTAYWNGASYLYSQAEDLASGSPACKDDNGTTYCGSRQNKYDVDSARLATVGWAGGLDVVYEFLNNTQKAALADRLLNDLDVMHNGSEASGTNCVNNGYIDSNLGVMTTTAPFVASVSGGGLLGLESSGFGPGSIVFRIYPGTGANFEILGRVKSIDSDRQLTFELGDGTHNEIYKAGVSTSISYSGQYWWYTRPFGYGGEKTCGVVWFMKHHASSPRMIPGQERAYGGLYGNIVNADDSPRQNKADVALAAYIQIALLLGDFDIRAVRLGEQAMNYYMTQTMAQEQKSRWGGFNGHGTQYGPDRVDISATSIAWAMKNSLSVTPPGILTGNYLKGIIGAYQYAVLLADPLHVIPWTTGYPFGSGDLSSERLLTWGGAMMFSALLYPNDPMTPVVWDYLRNRRGDFGNLNMDGGWGHQNWISMAWPLYDPGATKTPPTNQPLQRGVFGTDIDECIASGMYCRPDAGEAVAFSQTGWTGNDTQATLRGGAAIPNWDDGNYGEAGSLTIHQNNGTTAVPLLAGNGLGLAGLGSGTGPSSGLYDGNIISLYNDTDHDIFGGIVAGYQFARMDRWAGDPVNGVADNSYAYGRVNYTPRVREASSGYDPASAVQKSFFGPAAQAQNVTTEMIHFKSGAGLPNYVVVYDNVQAGTPNQLRHYWHLEVGITTGSTAAAARHPEWVAYDNAGKSASLTVPGAARLNLKTLAVAGSTNPTVALQADNYTSASGFYAQNTGIKSATWSAGSATFVLNGQPWWSYPLPADGSVSVTVSGPTVPAGYAGSWRVTGYSSAGPTVTVAMPSDPGGAWGSGGTFIYPPWCSYPTRFNPSGSCAGSFWRPNSGGLPGATFTSTYRVESCASTDGLTCDAEKAGEWLTVFQPSAKTNATMPPLSQAACTASGGNCTALEIQDSGYPKVAAFARQGALVNAMSFTTTHGGTAQYVVSGLAPGSYSVAVNGSTVKTAVVASGDTTLSFSSKAGAVSISGSSVAELQPSTRTAGESAISGKASVR